MDIALAIVDILAGNQHPPARKNRIDLKCWKCGLTAGKERKEIISAVQRENSAVLYRRIGSTTYKVHIHFSETTQESMEDKIIRLIGSETMDMAPECGIIKLPQMSRQPEGSTV